jgi:ParB-like chromosome segregation protein Spo0J
MIRFVKYWLGIAELVFSINEHGFRDPVVRMGNVVFDGSKRLIACRILGVEPVFHDCATIETNPQDLPPVNREHGDLESSPS